MVFCLKHFIPLLVLPYPTAAPLFVAVYFLSVCLTVKPCVYCTALLVVLFSSTCYTHLASVPPPGPHASSLSHPTNATTSFTSLLANLTQPASTPFDSTWLETTNLTDPGPVRCFCDANKGRVFDPVLVGYRRRDEIWRAEDERERVGKVEETAEEAGVGNGDEVGEGEDETEGWKRWVLRAYAWARSLVGLKEEEAAVQVAVVEVVLPKPRWDTETSRLDLRPRSGWAEGVGFVLDFGWGRSEEVVRGDLERARVRKREKEGKV